MAAQDIIIRPVITEKKYGWHWHEEVHLRSSQRCKQKIEIAKAVEELF